MLKFSGKEANYYQLHLASFDTNLIHKRPHPPQKEDSITPRLLPFAEKSHASYKLKIAGIPL